ncbi:hypothetical protein [Microviridae sp.]|nr:hypothetical protein [Microviridae sp.]
MNKNRLANRQLRLLSQNPKLRAPYHRPATTMSMAKRSLKNERARLIVHHLRDLQTKCLTTRRFIMAVEEDFIAMNIPISGEQVQSDTGPVNAQFLHFERKTLTYSEQQLVEATLAARAASMRLDVLGTLCEGRYLVTEMQRRRTQALIDKEQAVVDVQSDYAAQQKKRASENDGVYLAGTPEEITDKLVKAMK